MEVYLKKWRNYRAQWYHKHYLRFLDSSTNKITVNYLPDCTAELRVGNASADFLVQLWGLLQPVDPLNDVDAVAVPSMQLNLNVSSSSNDADLLMLTRTCASIVFLFITLTDFGEQRTANLRACANAESRLLIGLE